MGSVRRSMDEGLSRSTDRPAVVIAVAGEAGTVTTVNNTTVRLPREFAAECLAYSRCIKTDERAVDNVLLGWPSTGMLRRMVPSVAALTFGRPLSSLLLSTPVPQGEVSAVLLWSTGSQPERLEVPVGPTVVRALRRLRVAAWLWMVCAVLGVFLTGWVALALAPAAAYVAFRVYTLRRYWIRCKLAERDQLELRDVSAGFKAHVDALVAAARSAS
jgi:hypothetical protein